MQSHNSTLKIDSKVLDWEKPSTDEGRVAHSGLLFYQSSRKKDFLPFNSFPGAMNILCFRAGGAKWQWKYTGENDFTSPSHHNETAQLVSSDLKAIPEI